MPRYHDDGACMILDLPHLSDETALHMSEFLQAFQEKFDSCYEEQIQRAYYERKEDAHAMYCEHWFNQAQQSLPFDDDLPF
jgi:hypothetical protein